MKLEFETDNAAFDEYPAGEASQILKEVADRIVSGDLSGDIRDVNGNKIGHYELETEEAGA
jgi:hypothetical protein